MLWDVGWDPEHQMLDPVFLAPPTYTLCLGTVHPAQTPTEKTPSPQICCVDHNSLRFKCHELTPSGLNKAGQFIGS